MAAPEGQTMDEIDRILSPTKGLLVRQKLDKLEILCPALQKRNKYKVASMPTDKGENAEDWEDKTFKKALKHGKLFSMEEESEFCARCCCQSWREFKIKVKTSKKAGGTPGKVAEFHRPFKCTILCGCCMLNPQEITAEDANGNKLGRTVFDFRCMDTCCMKRHWKVEDANGAAVYFIEDNQCCNANCFAPIMCCPERRLDIYDASEENVVGALIDYWPGCTTRGCLGTADNFRIAFPDDATPQMKMTLLSSVVLIDFMLFEKADDDSTDGIGGA